MKHYIGNNIHPKVSIPKWLVKSEEEYLELMRRQLDYQFEDALKNKPEGSHVASTSVTLFDNNPYIRMERFFDKDGNIIREDVIKRYEP